MNLPDPRIGDGLGALGGEWQPDAQVGVSRVGVVDVGSNSVRMVVFDGLSRSPAYFYNEKILCGLGKGIHESGVLHPDGRKRALAAIHRFVELAHLLKVSQLDAVATAAVRVASDGPEFCEQVERETGLRIYVATGDEEAQLSAKGVLLGWPGANGIMCDMGGASMELAEMEEGVIGRRETSPLGPLQLANIESETAIDQEIERCLDQLHDAIPGKSRKIFLVGGSWRAIAKLDMVRRGYPLTVLHEYKMTPTQVADTRHWMREFSINELSALSDTSVARLELVPLAGRVLSSLLDVFEPESLAVSSYGLREGMLYDLMSEELRQRDPLLESARQLEKQGARFPGFGEVIFQWLNPLYRDENFVTRRLVYAACLLHDTGWRAHPDYRAEVCFDTITRANLCGVDHESRVFLGLAVLHRYKGSARMDFDPDVLKLLSAEKAKQADILGGALRLGSMLTGSAPGALEQTELGLNDEELTLKLTGVSVELQGEVVSRRLAALASKIGRTGRLILQ